MSLEEMIAFIKERIESWHYTEKRLRKQFGDDVYSEKYAREIADHLDEDKIILSLLEHGITY